MGWVLLFPAVSHLAGRLRMEFTVWFFRSLFAAANTNFAATCATLTEPSLLFVVSFMVMYAASTVFLSLLFNPVCTTLASFHSKECFFKLSEIAEILLLAAAEKREQKN